MSQHADILDDRDPLGRWLTRSVIFHLSVMLFFTGFGWWREHNKLQWGGDALGGQIGSVPVTAVSKIALPNRSVTPNLVASDTDHSVPRKPEKEEKAVPKEDPNAVVLDGKKKKPDDKIAAYLKKYQAVPERPNQLYSSTGSAASSPMYAKSGINGVGIGENTVAGRGCGGYLELIRQRIQVKWDADPVSSGLNTSVGLNLRLLRNGTVRDVSISQASRRNDVDYAARRAIMDAGPFPPFLPTCEGNEANIEVRFEPRR